MSKHLLIAALATVLTTCAFALPASNLSEEKSAIGGPNSNMSAGIGVGAMYGHLGANLEYRLTEQISASAGVGMNGQGQWFTGMRYYLKPEGNGSRARLTVGAATVNDNGSIIDVDGSGKTKVIFAVGGSWANADNEFRGFNIDLSTDGKLSVGYQF